MSIARRFLLLLSIPALLLVALGVAGWWQLRAIDDREAAAFDGATPRLAAIAALGRHVASMQAAVLTFVATDDAAVAVAARARFAVAEGESEHLLGTFADSLVVDDADRREVRESREAILRWARSATHVMALSDSGRRVAGVALAHDSLAALATPLEPTLVAWSAYHERIAVAARDDARRSVRLARDVLPFAILAIALVFIGVVALLWRQLIAPVRSLESAVALISAGTYALRVPHTQRRDETGSLARSIDALRLISVAIENERWIKIRTARITAAVQRAPSLEEFGAALLSELLPEIGSGAGALSVVADGSGALRRIVAYGVAPGAAEPIERIAWRLESVAGTLLGVVALDTERFITERERGLLATVMPQVAMALELLHLRRVAFPHPRLQG
jgi:HAMP domain-containing protein